jgi:hypothetical protein
VYANLALLAVFAFLYSIVAGRVERTPITGPIVFMAFGFLVGPFGVGWVEVTASAQEAIGESIPPLVALRADDSGFATDCVSPHDVSERIEPATSQLQCRSGRS